MTRVVALLEVLELDPSRLPAVSGERLLPIRRRDDAIGEIDSVVATGGALLANPAWIQILADVLARPLDVSGVAEDTARGAAVLEPERLGLPVPAAPPISHVVVPREERHQIHLHARAEQRALIQSREAT